MAASQDILLTWKTDTGEVTKSLSEITAGIDAIDSKVTDTTKNTSKMGAGLKTAGQTGAVGFKALGTAMKAAGIGLVVAAIALLVKKLTENKGIAEKLELVMAGIGVVFNQLVTLVAPLGDIISSAFNNPKEAVLGLWKTIKENLWNRIEGFLEFLPAVGKAIKLVFSGKFSEAGKVVADATGKMVLGVENVTDKISDAVDGVIEFGKTFVDETKKAISASDLLIISQQKLRDQQRDLNVEYAQARAKIEQLKQARDDERLSIEDRIAAAQEASELDQEFADKREAIANREVQLVQREIELQGETVERLDTLAEARIAAAEAAESSAAVQTELMTSIIGLQNEQIATTKEQDAAEFERVQNMIDRQSAIDDILEAGMKREIQKIIDKYKAEEVLAGLQGQILIDQDKAMQIEIDAVRAKFSADDVSRAKAAFQAKIDFALRALGALSALNEAFAGDTEKQQKKAFQRNKAIGISSAIISTAGAIVGAINPASGGLGIPAGLPGAAIAAATGIAQIATIAKTRFKSGAGTSPSSPSGGGGGAAGPPTPTAPQLDLSFLGGGAGQDGFRTYVIASEVSNSQQANQRINDQAALVG